MHLNPELSRPAGPQALSDREPAWQTRLFAFSAQFNPQISSTLHLVGTKTSVLDSQKLYTPSNLRPKILIPDSLNPDTA